MKYNFSFNLIVFDLMIFDLITQDVLSKITYQLDKYSRSIESKSIFIFKPNYKDYSYKDIANANNLILETSFFFNEEKNENFPKIKDAILIYEKALLEENKTEKNSRINIETAEYLHSNLVSAYWIIGNHEKIKENISFLKNYSETKKIASTWSIFLNRN